MAAGAGAAEEAALELFELAAGVEEFGSEQPARAATTRPADSAATAPLVLIRM